MAGDTIIFRDTQISSRAVYQCNTSNEHGYLLANAFVSVLGESLPTGSGIFPGSSDVMRQQPRHVGQTWGGEKLPRK